jgi:malonyl-CoA/methylmalonyl-CoA synthetase
VTILDLFDATLVDRFGAPAYGDVTHGALHAGALRVATALARRGVRAGDRLALFSENRVGFVYAYLAALRMGAVVVPTNILYRASDLQHVVDDSAASAVVVSASTVEHVAALERAPATIAVDDVERWAHDETLPPLHAPLRDEQSLAMILYTSGTTGRSKGAMLTLGNLAAIAAQIVVAWRWRADDALLIALPLFHMHGLGAALNGTLVAGSRITVHERFDAERVLAELGSGAHTMFFGVPTMYVRLLERASTVPAPRVRLYVSGSAALSADVHAAFEERFGASILERYGASEFGFVLTNRYAGPRVPGAVGVPSPGAAVAIVDSDGASVEAGGVGELLVAGPTVFAGYWNRPDATAEAFTQRDGTRYFRSGDLASYDPQEGVYRLVGRTKELIVSGGFNVYPREVETEIERFPGVRACAVVGKPDPARGELPVAFLELDAAVDAEALVAHLRTRLASFKVPRDVRVVDALPRNALGKIEKARLRALL